MKPLIQRCGLPAHNIDARASQYRGKIVGSNFTFKILKGKRRRIVSLLPIKHIQVIIKRQQIIEVCEAKILGHIQDIDIIKQFKTSNVVVPKDYI